MVSAAHRTSERGERLMEALRGLDAQYLGTVADSRLAISTYRLWVNEGDGVFAALIFVIDHENLGWEIAAPLCHSAKVAPNLAALEAFARGATVHALRQELADVREQLAALRGEKEVDDGC